MSVAVVGWGLRTALGSDADAALSALLRGETAARPPRSFDGTDYRAQLVAEIDGDPAPSRHARYLRRLALLGCEVAQAALRQSGVATGDRLGLFAAVGGLRVHWQELMGPMAQQRADASDCWQRGLRGLHPHWLLRHLSNNAHALLAADIHARGDGATLAGATAGAQAIAAASRALNAGAIDAALIVAYDRLLEPETLVDLGQRGLPAMVGLQSWVGPYAGNAGGMIPGEAAAALVLVREAEAPLCWVQARATADGELSEPAGSTLAAAAAPLARGIAVVDGAARGVPTLDSAERIALGSVVDGNAALLATAAGLGQTGAAAAVVQTIVLALVLRSGMLPPIACVDVPAVGPLRPVVTPTPTAATAALGLCSGAPGLAAAVRVDVEKPR